MTTFATSINYPQSRTPIILGSELIRKHTDDPILKSGRSVFIVIDANVMRLHAAGILKSFLGDRQLYLLPSGEKQKSLRSAAKLLKWLHDQHTDRKSLLIAIGGGVTTDLCGFVASTYMRGIDYISVPTTLVAQLDAAIGGKTAINLAGTKNIIGTFFPPRKIVCDSGFLSTLEPRQVRDGLVEAVKIFAARDRLAFQRHAARLPGYLSGDNLNKLIADAVRLKSEVVNRDPFEKDLRRVLNLGHTAGHAYEALTGHSHGKSVAFGMLVALDLSQRLVGLSRGDADSIRSATLSLYRSFAATGIGGRDLWERIQRDKKKSGSIVNFVLLKKCGEHVVKSVNYPQFVRSLEAVMEMLKS